MLSPVQLPQKTLTLIKGTRSYLSIAMFNLMVDLALQMPITVLIAGNHFPVYDLNYEIAARSDRYEYILAHHIKLTRAETCYQVAALLGRVEATEYPILVLDLLTTFSDEGVTERENNELFFESLTNLTRLSQTGPVFVSTRTRDKDMHFINALHKKADAVHTANTTFSLHLEML
jgi:hypothetical protein